MLGGENRTPSFAFGGMLAALGVSSTANAAGAEEDDSEAGREASRRSPAGLNETDRRARWSVSFLLVGH